MVKTDFYYVDLLSRYIPPKSEIITGNHADKNGEKIPFTPKALETKDKI